MGRSPEALFDLQGERDAFVVETDDAAQAVGAADGSAMIAPPVRSWRASLRARDLPTPLARMARTTRHPALRARGFGFALPRPCAMKVRTSALSDTPSALARVAN